MRLLKHCNFIIGNTSSGVREAPVYGVPTINIGTRQTDRNKSESIYNVKEDKNEILGTIGTLTKNNIRFPINTKFGDGHSAERFYKLIRGKRIWNIRLQKKFISNK